MSYFYACAQSNDLDAEFNIHCVRDTEKFQMQELILNGYTNMALFRLDKTDMERKRPVSSTAGAPRSAWNILSILTTPHITGEEAHLRSEFPGKSIAVTNFADQATAYYYKQKESK